MIGCLYIPEYSAWALQYLNKQSEPVSDELEEGLAVVDDGRVVASTAQHAGVAAGTSRSVAEKAAVPIYERNLRVEAAVWIDVMQGLNAHTPRIQPVYPGLLYFSDIDPEVLSSYLRETGMQAAYAPDRPAAQLGALCAPPSTLQCLTHPDIAALLEGMRVEQLLRVDYPPAMVEQLKEAGYDRLGPLQDVSRRRLQADFGTPGKRLHRLLHPSRVDRAPVPLYTAPDAVSRAIRWHTPVAHWQTAQPALARLVSQAVSELGAKACQHVTVQWVDAETGAVRRASRVLSAPTRVRSALLPVAHTLLRRLMHADAQAQALRVVLGALAIPEVYPDVFFRQTRRSQRSMSLWTHSSKSTDHANAESSVVLDNLLGDEPISLNS